MNWHTERASRLQRQVMRDEEFLNDQPENDEIKRAIMNTRADLILVISYLDTSILYLRSIRRILRIILIICLLFFIHNLFRGALFLLSSAGTNH